MWEILGFVVATAIIVLVLRRLSRKSAELRAVRDNPWLLLRHEDELRDCVRAEIHRRVGNRAHLARSR